jgi:hypothetical protein
MNDHCLGPLVGEMGGVSAFQAVYNMKWNHENGWGFFSSLSFISFHRKVMHVRGLVV